MNFRHLLERNGLSRQIFKAVRTWLNESGVLVKEATLLDARLIEAPSSTRNKAGKGDPEMHQTKKGNQWYLGMKAHLGVDARTGLAHDFTTTAAHAHELNQAEHLLYGKAAFIFADSGYRGAKNRETLAAVEADWQIAEMPGKLKELIETTTPQSGFIENRVSESQYSG